MPTTEEILHQWPKPTEALELPGLIRTLNRWKPAGDIVITVDGAGSAITTTAKTVYLPCPAYKFIITGWMIIGDVAGDAEFDIWKAAYPSVPTVADTITAAAKPTITAAQAARSTDVSTWADVTVEEDDILAIKLDSVSTFTKLSLALSIARGDLR